MKKFGDLVSEYRLSLGLTIREFCLKNNVDSIVLSKIERGIQVPKNNEIAKFIEALKIFEGSAEHLEFLNAYENFTQETFSI